MLSDAGLFLLCFLVVLKSAQYAVRYSTRLGAAFGMSEFIISFFIVAVVSALPETVVATISHLEGDAASAVMTLLGSNVADLTLVFGIIAIYAGGIKVESKLLRMDIFYLLFLLLPLLLAWDGALSRIDGIVLILCGAAFFYTLVIQRLLFHKHRERHYGHIMRMSMFLAGSVLLMVLSAHFALHFAEKMAIGLGIAELLIVVFVIGIGSCMPELVYSIRAVQQEHNNLALGDILGTVIIDATIVLGAIAVAKPIMMDATLFRATALFNVLSAVALILFIKLNNELTRKEGLVLTAIYAVFAGIMLVLL